MTQTDGHMNGHCDFDAESAQLANSVKACRAFGALEVTNLILAVSPLLTSLTTALISKKKSHTLKNQQRPSGSHTENTLTILKLKL